MEFEFLERELVTVCEQEKIAITKEQLLQFFNYYKLLVEWNEKINLTAITEIEAVYKKHFIDSIMVAKFLKPNSTVCDIGTGAGFPGLVLKIVRPDLNIVLVDSLNKRIEFLKKVVSDLNLNNIKCLHNRAEDSDFKKGYLNSFDYVVARAVAKLNTLTEYCLPFVKIGGSFVSMKTVDVDEELAQAKACISTLGGKIDSVNKYNLYDMGRSVVVVKKVKDTSNKYPRGQNKPRLMPLK